MTHSNKSDRATPNCRMERAENRIVFLKALDAGGCSLSTFARVARGQFAARAHVRFFFYYL